MTLDEDDIEAIAAKLAEKIKPDTQPKKEFFTTEEFAKEFNKSRYTVSEYCRLGRIKAVKDKGSRKFLIPYDEFERYRREGTLSPIIIPKTSKHYKASRT
jgi:excisionase family DNA binding protein